MNRVLRMLFILTFVFIISGQTTDRAMAEKPTKVNPHSQANDRFFFVQITDTHFDDFDHSKRTKGIVEEINQLPLKIEFVVHTGDITRDLLDEEEVVTESLVILNKLKAPIYYIPGNHDIVAYDVENTRQSFIKSYGKLIRRINVHGVAFIFMYTEPLATSIVLPGYNPFEQLQTMLRESNQNPVVICHHNPSVAAFYSNKMHPGWPEKNRKRWAALLKDYNVKAVIAGHFHKDEHHWLGDIPLYVSASVAGYFGRQASYRIYEYYNGRISYRTQYR